MNSGSVTNLGRSRHTGLNRSMWPTARMRLASSAADTISSASRMVGANGFSTRTFHPRARAWTATARWVSVGVATTAASTWTATSSIDAA